MNFYPYFRCFLTDLDEIRYKVSSVFRDYKFRANREVHTLLQDLNEIK
jgi:hypothetical protein